MISAKDIYNTLNTPEIRTSLPKEYNEREYKNIITETFNNIILNNLISKNLLQNLIYTHILDFGIKHKTTYISLRTPVMNHPETLIKNCIIGSYNTTHNIMHCNNDMYTDINIMKFVLYELYKICLNKYELFDFSKDFSGDKNSNQNHAMYIEYINRISLDNFNGIYIIDPDRLYTDNNMNLFKLKIINSL